jgi:hypothetical protein
MRFVGPLIAVSFCLLAMSRAVHAELLVEVDRPAQRMTVTLNGEELYEWPVSTGGRGYETPGGTFKPFRMEIDHYSEEYDNAPMPHSIFFTQTGIAIHGTYEQRNLGHAVSHGCVRLSLKNAATLWALVKREKMANTKVVLRGAMPDRTQPVARRFKSGPLNAERPSQSASRVDESQMSPALPMFLLGR